MFYESYFNTDLIGTYGVELSQLSNNSVKARPLGPFTAIYSGQSN